MAKSDLGLPIISLSDSKESTNILVYGKPGVGKTVFAGSAPNSVFLATEPGTISAKRRGSKADLIEAYDWESIERAILAFVNNPNHGYDWIIIDTLTTMQQRMMRWILDRAVEENPKRDLDLPAIQDHQKWQNMYRRYVSMLLDTPANVLFLAHMMIREDEDGDEMVLPSVQGKNFELATWTCGMMDVIGYMGKKTLGKKGEERREVRRMLWEDVPPYTAKDRFDTLGRSTDDATMSDVAAKLNVDSGPAAPRKRVGARKDKQSA